MKDIQIDNYLNRIELSDCNHDIESLIKLQQNHMECIPFENLDVVVGRPIHLDNDHLFEKIVMKYRGGYCFELNLLYASLLKSLGFSIQPVLGRVWLRNPTKTPPRNHLAHLVKLNGATFITDVGFGGLTTRIPLNINDKHQVNDNDGIVRVLPLDTHQYMIQREVKGIWENQYSFENTLISTEDITMSNHYMSTHPNSHFKKDNFIGKFTKTGRIGLFNNQMSIREGIEIVEKKQIKYGSKWINTLKTNFNLTANFSDKELVKIFNNI
ncbi:arylamine N-acetyltransferase [Aquimarina sp. AU119]|uniref:arylamine N-acetyltransferase family protein n=1 Tax=Aquimarina sp. AU119 TaxID=2108528 RepID=UPI000D686FFA|nr:arylamine N-acetyltransferase [Aquimarina sp. AU119]